MATTSVQTRVKSFTASEPHEPTGQFLISLRDILWLILWKGVEWIPVVQDTKHWRAHVNAVINLEVS